MTPCTDIDYDGELSVPTRNYRMARVSVQRGMRGSCRHTAHARLVERRPPSW